MHHTNQPPPPPLQGGQHMPSHCLSDAKCQLPCHLQPIVTAPRRFGNLLPLCLTIVSAFGNGTRLTVAIEYLRLTPN